MNEAFVAHWLPYMFPFFFLGMWLAVSTLLGLLSGWFNLQQSYADDDREEPLLTLRGQSGSMGFGANFSGVLKFRAYRSGLGIRVSRIFGPFQKPLKVPWSAIDAEPRTSFFMPMVKLQLGRPAEGRLTISAATWARLANAAYPAQGGRPDWMPSAAPVERRSIGRAMLLQWLLVSGVAAAFFYFAPRLSGERDGPPIAVIVLPAIVVGISQIVRYVRER